MPYYRKRFRRTGRRFFKRRFISKGTRQRRFYRKAMSVKRAKPEIKWLHDSLGFNPLFDNTTNAPQIYNTFPTGITQGPNFNQRIGNKVKSLRITLEASFFISASAGASLSQLFIPVRISIVTPRIDETRARDYITGMGQIPFDPKLFHVWKDYVHEMANPFFVPAGVSEPVSYSGASANDRCIVKFKKSFAFPRIYDFTFNSNLTGRYEPINSTTTDPSNIMWMIMQPQNSFSVGSAINILVRYKYRFSYIDI